MNYEEEERIEGMREEGKGRMRKEGKEGRKKERRKNERKKKRGRWKRDIGRERKEAYNKAIKVDIKWRNGTINKSKRNCSTQSIITTKHQLLIIIQNNNKNK